MRLQTYLRPQNFYDVYCLHISAKLKKIDIFLKTNCRGIGISAAADILNITSDEVRAIMKEEDIARLTKKNFYKLMLRGSSDICRYISREASLGFPATYTLDDIAYIYDLDLEDVQRAGDITGIHEATAMTLPCLFYHIPV